MDNFTLEELMDNARVSGETASKCEPFVLGEHWWKISGSRPSRWNRAGNFIEFSIASLGVFDEELQEWRRMNADRTVERPASMGGIVCATSFFDISRDARAIITRPVSRIEAVDRLCEHVKEVALPWFRSSGDQAGLARAVPDALLRPTGFAQDPLEFLVSRGHMSEARSLIQRVLELGEFNRESFSEGRDIAVNGEWALGIRRSLWVGVVKFWG